MEQILVLNLVGVVFFAALVGLLGGSEDGWGDRPGRVFLFFYVLAIGLILSFFGWVIFVAQHFIGKYW